MNLTQSFSIFETYDMTLIVLGLGVLGLATLLHRFDGKPYSYPIVVLALSFLTFKLIPGLIAPDPIKYSTYAVHLTEIGVILSLMGVGLKIDHRPTFKTWSVVWRLLIITMPLSIAATAVIGWSLVGLTPAAAVLLAAALAPTDPVLAADLQVGEPDESHHDNPAEKEDEVQFALTAEAGLNDALAFPFTYLALLIGIHGVSPDNWGLHWLSIDLLYRLSVGLIVGVGVGRVLATVLLRLPTDTEMQKMRTGVGALAATLLIYGLTEIVGGYGFLAVIVGAVTIRHYDKTMGQHRSLHIFSEQSEQLLLTAVLIALGGAIAGGLLVPLTTKGALLALALIFVIRPLTGYLGLWGSRRLHGFDRGIVAFFGIRGVGSLFYLAYALDKQQFADRDLLWAITGFTIVISIVVHGTLAAPAMNYHHKRLA